MSWSTSLLRMKPPCVVKPLHLCSPKAPRSRKRRRDSCFHNLNGYILTNLPLRKASAKRVARLYRKRWTLETAFQHLEAYFHSEINTLGYPKAALFGFCLAL